MSIDESQVTKAVKALLAYEKKQAEKKGKQDLIDEDSTKGVYLIVATKKMPEKLRIKPQRVPLPHPLYAESEVCLITKDPQRVFKDLLQAKSVKNVSRVMGISKLKAKFKPYEAKRQLCASYDLFLADERILPLLPSALGKIFFQRKKQPVPVDLKKNDLSGEISSALQSTFLILNNGGCNAVKIGKTDFTVEQLVENVSVSIPEIAKKIPRRWDNIQSIHLKTSDSAALPIYNALPDGPVPTESPSSPATNDKQSKERSPGKTKTVKKQGAKKVVKMEA